MNKEDFINSVLLDWSMRISSGILLEDLNEENLEGLHSSLVSNGIDEDKAIEVVNEVSVIVEKGKHPERQAYNKNGILVTFPTPEYKARAIAKGTHSEQNPKVAQSNLFGGGQQAPSSATPDAKIPAPQGSTPMDAGQSTLPSSDSSQTQTPPAQKELPDTGTPGTPAVPSTPSSAPSASSVGTPAQGQLASEPVAQSVATPTNVSPPPQPPTPLPTTKSPGEVAAEKEIIKKIMSSNDSLAPMGNVGLEEQLKKLTKVAIEMNLNEAVKFLSKHL